VIIVSNITKVEESIALILSLFVSTITVFRIPRISIGDSLFRFVILLGMETYFCIEGIKGTKNIAISIKAPIHIRIFLSFFNYFTLLVLHPYQYFILYF